MLRTSFTADYCREDSVRVSLVESFNNSLPVFSQNLNMI